MNKYLKLLLIANSLFVFASSLIVPIYAALVLEVGGGVELAGLLVGTQFLAGTFFGIVVIKLADRKNRDERLIKANYLLRALAWFFIFLFPSIPGLFLAQLIIGVSEAIGTPAFNALVSEHLDTKSHIKEWATFGLVSNFIVAIASVVGGIVAVRLGFPLLFLMMSLLGLGSFFLLQLGGGKRQSTE